MDGPADPRHGAIMSTNAALRVWAEGLRAWSRSTRVASEASRRQARQLRPRPRAGDVRVAVDCGDGLPALGPIPVAELLQMLVLDHGFDVDQAARALAAGMLAAGYPSDFDRVGAADAFDLVQEIIHGRRW
jgi:hypothetical protein